METILQIQSPFDKLSKREKEVLDLMLKGALVKHISEPLGLKSNTISTVKKNIMQKTGATNSIDLFKMAQEHSLLK
jgi:DNA-binding NarL/FixJ family response regulator